jgi:hypothetical protein
MLFLFTHIAKARTKTPPPLPRRGGGRTNDEKPSRSNKISFFISAKAIGAVSWKMSGVNMSQVEKPISLKKDSKNIHVR